MHEDLLQHDFLDVEIPSRATLLPRWIKVFSWIFFVIGAISPLLLVFGLVTHSMALALYGLEADTIYCITGVVVFTLFLFKGVVGYGLIRREDWAVKLAVADAAVGIAVCVFSTIMSVMSNDTEFRLELLFLIPYLLKMWRIGQEWDMAQK